MFNCNDADVGHDASHLRRLFPGETAIDPGGDVGMDRRGGKGCNSDTFLQAILDEARPGDFCKWDDVRCKIH